MTLNEKCLLAGLAGIIFTVGAAVANEYPVKVTGLWESKYVLEGRDILGTGGLVSVEATTEWRHATLGAWFAAADSISYRELNLSAELAFAFAGCEAYLGYTRLEFITDDEGDNELTTGVAMTSLPWVTPALDYTYSTEASGGFLEISLRLEIPLFDGRLTLEPYALEGFDFGFASDDYNGPNHLELGIDIGAIITNRVSLIGLIAHSWAHADVARDELDDLSWAAVGLRMDL